MTQEQSVPSPQALSLTTKPVKQRVFNIAQFVLRVLVPFFTLAATIVTLKSGQTIQTEFGFSFTASYKFSSAIRYQLIVDIVVGVSCLLSLVFVYLFTRPTWNIKNYFYIFLFDLVLLLLITSACTAGTSIGMIARNGESRIGWSSICWQVQAFCHKITLAIAFSYLALSCMAILTIMSVSKLRS
ncbi:CASP-like protein 1F2 [Apium graveolens]|uniref:CASP-like protein 1F2 n=1 Tax=Apium graveolens TaxID=4045 RepID=UPI003D7B9821